MYITKKLPYIEVNKLPVILIHFVYGQILIPDMRVFSNIAQLLGNSLNQFPPKQLAQTIYSLSRVRRTDITPVIQKGAEMFYEKSRDSKEFSRERVTVMWSISNSGQVNQELFLRLLKAEIPCIAKQNVRTFAQFLHSIGALSLEMDLEVHKSLLKEIMNYLEKSKR